MTKDARDADDDAVGGGEDKLLVCGAPTRYVPEAVPLGCIVENVVKLEKGPYVVRVTKEAGGLDDIAVGVEEAGLPVDGTPT